jgi:hypothetical protein
MERQVLDSIVTFLDARGVETSELVERQTTILNQGVLVSGGSLVAGQLAVGRGAKVRAALRGKPQRTQPATGKWGSPMPAREGKNAGVIVTGGALSAGSLAVGRHARITAISARPVSPAERERHRLRGLRVRCRWPVLAARSGGRPHGRHGCGRWRRCRRGLEPLRSG